MPFKTLPPVTPREAKPLIFNGLHVCPECAGPLARASGCISCLQCGWGRCG